MKKGRFWKIVLAAAIMGLAPVDLAAWGSTQRLSWTTGNSDRPALAADSNAALHLVWSDDTAGNFEVYYK